MKKRMCLLLTGLAVSTAPMVKAVDNVIVFVADGMGFEHIKATRAYMYGNPSAQLWLETLGIAAQTVTTLPNNGITDSATASTALATGYQHPENGTIGMGYSGTIKSNLIEIAKSKGMKTVLITTGQIGSPSAGAFAAHEPDGGNAAAIRLDYLLGSTSQHHTASLPDIILGGGYDDPAIVSGSLTYVSLAKSLGYTFVNTATALENTYSQRILGLFGNAWEPLTPMAYRAADSPQPTVSQMVLKALSLGQGAGGYLIIVDCANIDNLSRQNDANVVMEISELENAVQTAKSWVAANAQFYDNNFMFVIANHETGALQIPNQQFAAGTVPALNFGKKSPTAENVPFFATAPVFGQAVIDNTDAFFLIQDAMYTSKGGYPPVITGLTISGLGETQATLQWTTFEPSSSVVELSGGGQTVTSTGSGGTTHSVSCTGLSAGTTYNFTVKSTDLAGKTGKATGSFLTVGSNPNAIVISEPVVTQGTVSGTYNGVTALGDGLKQNILEAADAVGAGLTVDYTLRTWVPAAQMDTLTINASYTWTGSLTTDPMLAYIRVIAPDGTFYWEKIDSFPFLAQPAASYIDGTGAIVVRFEDFASTKRETKDTLSIDSLVGAVVKTAVAPVVPTAPTVSVTPPTGPSVSLTWLADRSQQGFQLWRHNSSSGWKLLLETASTSYTDKTVSAANTYDYVVRAYNEDAYADSQPATVDVPAPPLAAPSNLKVATVKGVVTVTWTDSNSTESGYEVWRSVNGGSYALVGKLAANATKYADRATTRGSTYSYKVRAVNNGSLGPEAGPVSITP